MKNNKIRLISLATVAAASLALTSCATTTSPYASGPTYGYSGNYDYGYRPGNNYHEHFGTVARVRYVEGSGATGAVIGAVVGGAAGNQIGDGTGRKAATVGGAIAGGLIGREIDQRNSAPRRALDIRMDGGEVVTIIQEDGRFQEGQRVRVMGTGTSMRVVAY